MKFTIEEFNPNKLASVKVPSHEVLTFIGEVGVRNLISDHYDLLILSDISGLFPSTEKGFEAAKKHSADFFIQLMGGPDYFNQNRGNPMMRRRHAPFKITPEARVIWLECYIEAIEKLNAPDDIKKSYWDYVNSFSTWMVNSESEKR
ncbi:MAG: hypothetical protein KAH10_00250 [Flavobacteriales bacterium]|nr:hypothetical protein [Flavobacteriales bacterium]